jgi:hypothetical protein
MGAFVEDALSFEDVLESIEDCESGNEQLSIFDFVQADGLNVLDSSHSVYEFARS